MPLFFLLILTSYPDLIDKSKAPTYRIERDPNSLTGETCLIRFMAGPPYEDIAFKIINKDLEYNHKRGFKCTFDRGILHLYFKYVSLAMNLYLSYKQMNVELVCVCILTNILFLCHDNILSFSVGCMHSFKRFRYRR